ncbi:MAG: hypothetical protein JXA57_19060 [Armatimonadetes bacterium]|nr:hypothetical protein [Armatimonadota bacterium]
MKHGFEHGDFVLAVGHEGGTEVPRCDATPASVSEMCRVSIVPGAIEITTDSGGIYAVFGDLETGVLSSSMTAVLAGGGRKRAINSDALCEQLVTGAIAGQETSFRGIERLDGCGTKSVRGTRVSFQRFGRGEECPSPPSFRDSQACIDFQLGVLRARFRDIGAIVGDRGVSMGLSGGYDSRLMLLLALEARIPVHPFTFASASHTRERAIAGELARHLGLNLRSVVVRPMDELDDTALDANIDDAITYHDGRTNKTMGTFGDAHTARTQRECLSGAALNVNGLGGELYRNRERFPRYAFSFKDWLWHYVIGPHGGGVFTSARARDGFEERLALKYGELLGLGKLARLDRHLARRWYREIWLPFFAGPRLSAENRVGPALMPFADGAVSSAALAATPFIGSHGEFEAALLRRVDEKSAALPSSYGPGFAPSPESQRLRDQALALVPLQVRLARHRMLRRPSRDGSGDARTWRERLDGSLRFLEAMKLPLRIDFLLQDQVSRDRTLYIAEYLHRHRQYLDVPA